MRIKLYEEFQLNDEKIKQDIEDIFVELSDKGYSINVNVNTQLYKFRCDTVSNLRHYSDYEVILVKNSGIDFSEISEYVMMFKDYLTDYNYGNIKWYSWSVGHSKFSLDNEFDKIEQSRITKFGEWSNNSWLHHACELKISFYIYEDN